MSDKNNNQPSYIERWKRGDPLTAENLNKTVDSINEQRGIKGPRPKRNTGIVPPSGSTLIAMQYVSGEENFFYATPLGETTVLRVAKPYQLRNSVTSRDGITYTYSDEQTRSATNGSTTETQVVVPNYVAGDIIYASTAPIGGTTVVDELGNAVPLIDMNLDGRAWAKQ